MPKIIAALVMFISSLFAPISSPVKSLPIFALPQPTPFLFEEMTIPYLRKRSYDGRLGELIQVGQNANYQSFLTSFTSDNFKVNGLLTRPTGETPPGGWPAVVLVHGYIAPQNYRTQSNYTAHVDYLARNGLVVFKIDLRGHDKSEGEAGGAYYSADYVIDTLSAYSALQKADFVNADKVGLWGHSMAGNITFRGLAVKPDIPAVVIWAGAGYTYSDLLTYRISDNSYRPPPTDTPRARQRQKLRGAYGDFDPAHWFWKQIPATNYLDQVKGAIQIHHAVDDAVVSIEYSRNLMTILDSTNIPHTLFEYPSGGHNLTGSSFARAMQRTVEFYKENL
ncbi:MAG: alpha/beta fold hydrolase [bacterium]|nr:alpha/beta fold hydrolase [bacterium]